ncbi:TPR repeat protein [Phenylobacterium zucineum HLK1]|uniref:TPR repeat protein n=1 Tax=Phenylobacterium zucineum (strain HLK1) TaxID=450851 RepID=B4REE4_PHEZH|nr:tetratricopeptide repeat-containing glycosyltransferase family protein [Phenylobacterium zucineum]ACG76886.1 TPR repeat protein [Phenylobacterium zucineum HLK1]
MRSGAHEGQRATVGPASDPAALRRLFDQAVQRHQAGDHAAAGRLYEAVLAGGPDRGLRADVLANLASILRNQDRFAEAEAALRDCLRLSPDHLSGLANLANLLIVAQRYEEARACIARSLALAPDDRLHRYRLGLAWLGEGDYAAGLPLYELRDDRARTPLRSMSTPEWDGGPLEGRSVFIWREQGYGDELQMARFIPALKAAGAGRVMVAPTRALVRLFGTLEGVDEVLEMTGRVAAPPHDVWALPFSLPHRLGVTLETLPAAPYLRAPEAARAAWKGFAPEGGVGFVWHGNPAQPVERYRGLPSPELLQPLAEHVRLIDLQEPRGDFADTAAILEQLDLVITTDTAMAHLAGALGRPCWVMLPAVGCDWRWLRRRPDSPWYPSLRLWRQETPGDWAPVIAAMKQELASNGPPGRRP